MSTANAFDAFWFSFLFCNFAVVVCCCFFFSLPCDHSTARNEEDGKKEVFDSLNSMDLDFRLCGWCVRLSMATDWPNGQNGLNGDEHFGLPEKLHNNLFLSVFYSPRPSLSLSHSPQIGRRLVSKLLYGKCTMAIGFIPSVSTFCVKT